MHSSLRSEPLHPARVSGRGSHPKTRPFLTCPWLLSQVYQLPQMLSLVASPFPSPGGVCAATGAVKGQPEAARAAGKGEPLNRCTPGPLGQTNRPELPQGSHQVLQMAQVRGRGRGPFLPPPFPESSKPFPSVLLANIPIAPMAARDFMAIFISPAPRLCRDGAGILQ